MVKIKDIAQAVGVSTATVSNVIHGKDQKVSPEVRKKIKQAIDEMGYVPNRSALMLAQTHSDMIGVVIGSKPGLKITLDDPYYSSLIGHLEYEIRRRHKYMLIIAQQEEEEILHQAAAWNLDGLIVCNMSKKVPGLHRKFRGPMVSIDSYLDQETDFIQIKTDDYGGGYEAGRYLISKGHREIAMVADNDRGVDHSRWLGFSQAVSDSGTAKKAGHILIAPKDVYDMEDFKRLLPEFRKYSALFFASDFYALEACSFFQSQNISVPEDISVMGFDDLMYARLSLPKLTTIRQDLGQKAHMAVEALLNCQMQGEHLGETFQGKRKLETGEKSHVVPVCLVERESVREQ